MRRICPTRRSSSATILLSALLLSACGGDDGGGGATALVSVASNGTQANDFSGVESPYGRGVAVSGDGEIVAFSSFATNLAAGDVNGTYDVFVHDRRAGTTACVSVDSAGVPGNAGSSSPSISADGRFVAFTSAADNLVSGDENGAADVFVRDRLSGVTERASAGFDANIVSTSAAISADGRFVAFATYAWPPDPNDAEPRGIYVRDRFAASTERIDLGPDGAPYDAGELAISADGRFVAFFSFTNVVTDDTNGVGDIFVHDRQAGATERVSVGSSGMQGNYDSRSPRISGDGRFVVFHSLADGLVPGDTNETHDVFVRDRETGETRRASVGSDGAEGNDESSIADISADGRFVSFHSAASNLDHGDDNAMYDVFVHDLVSGETTRVSLAAGGGGANSSSFSASLSGDGAVVAFASGADNLVRHDTNERGDVFVRDW
jgi:Tol biopolymer transport system component